jgi:hypothetical protein
LRHRETNKSVRVRRTSDGQPFLSNFLIAPDEVKKAGLENCGTRRKSGARVIF